MSELDQKLSQQILLRQNMRQVIGILENAKREVYVASALIIKHQGQQDKKLKIIDNCLDSLNLLQDEIEKEFF